MVAQGQKPAAWVLFAGGRLSKGSYCSRDSLWGRETFLAAVAAHGGGRKASGLWWLLLGLRGQPLEATAGGTQGGKGEERERVGGGRWRHDFFVNEGRSTHNPDPSFFLFIHLFIYLPRFIFLRGPTKKLLFVCSHILNKIII